jgi:hypothetical protein
MVMSHNSEASQSGVQMLHPGSRKLFRYWEALRAERPCPNRSEIDLRQIVEIMPNLAILEFDGSQSKWIYRLVGTEICALMGSSQTRKNALAGWDSFEKDVVSKSLFLAQDRTQPCLVRMRLVFNGAPILPAEMVILPVYQHKIEQIQLFAGIFPLLGGRTFLPAPLLRRELVSTRMIWTEHETGDALLEQVGRKASPMLRVIQGGLASH